MCLKKVITVIISASRRTDIPAFFGEWFIKGIRAGFVDNVNPRNSKQVRRISLRPEDVDVIVFWTKNPQPFLKHLDELEDKSYKFYFQFTMNDYPRLFETTQDRIENRIDTFRLLSTKLGANKVLWRYDPIIISNITNVNFHIDQISYIAKQLKGFTERLTISFLDLYDKVRRRFDKLKATHNLEVTDLTLPMNHNELVKLADQIQYIASANGMKVYNCAEKVDLTQYGIYHAGCIDGQLIKSIFNIDKDFVKDKSQRAECLCAKSVDVGMYDTCKAGCTYCYANDGDGAIECNNRKHILDSPCLVGEYPEL
jgi:DNA repair photolyase